MRKELMFIGLGIFVSTKAALAVDVFDDAQAHLLPPYVPAPGYDLRAYLQCGNGKGGHSNALLLETDFDSNNKPRTLVTVGMVLGNGGFVDFGGTDTKGYAFSDVACINNGDPPPPNPPSDPAQMLIRFYDATQPGYTKFDSTTWKEKAVPSVSIDGSNYSGLICPRNSTAYFQVRAFTEQSVNGVFKGVEIPVASSLVPGNYWTRYFFSNPAGVKEVYIHSDYCENELNQLSLGTGATPYISSNPSVSGFQVEGRTTTLTVTAQSSEPLTYQWYKDGKAVVDGQGIVQDKPGRYCIGKPRSSVHVTSGAKTSSLTIQNLRSTDSGTYTVSVTNSHGTVTSQPTNLNVFGFLPKPCINVKFPPITQIDMKRVLSPKPMK